MTGLLEWKETERPAEKKSINDAREIIAGRRMNDLGDRKREQENKKRVRGRETETERVRRREGGRQR